MSVIALVLTAGLHAGMHCREARISLRRTKALPGCVKSQKNRRVSPTSALKEQIRAAFAATTHPGDNKRGQIEGALDSYWRKRAKR